MRRVLLSVALLATAALAACSPLDVCINNASAEYRGLVREAEDARLNIARGYRIEPKTVTVPEFSTCVTPEGEPYGCYEPTTKVIEKRVPINVYAEQARLDAIEEQIPAAQARMESGIAACRAAYPDE